MKRKVVLYGAFDRYNYGDNLMPILIERFFEKFHPKVYADLDFIYASIKKSDLSKYFCKPTQPMRDLLDVPDGTSVIVVGGEVLSATVGILYTHVQDSLLKTNVLRLLRRFSPAALNAVAKMNYDAVWDYPYVPIKSTFKNKIKVIYNTVGGIPTPDSREHVKAADYISSRDERTFDGLSGFCKTELVPDSVLIASKIVDDAFFDRFVRQEVKDSVGKKSITVQACPYKVGFTAQELADQLDRSILEYGVDVILLPIGYASGHDDVVFLKKVRSLGKGNFRLLDDLNVWEIMYVISKSVAFYGTSLHGVITAMSFSVPHFSINDEIEKLTSFINTWSVSPFNHPIKIKNLAESINSYSIEDVKNLNMEIEKAQSIISKSLDNILNLL